MMTINQLIADLREADEAVSRAKHRAARAACQERRWRAYLALGHRLDEAESWLRDYFSTDGRDDAWIVTLGRYERGKAEMREAERTWH